MSVEPEIVVEESLRARFEGLAGRRKDVATVASVAVAAVVLGVALAGRGAPAKVAPPASAPAESTSPDAPAGGTVMVHVAGAVRTPGLYRLAEGSRVADAVDAAGGPRRRADLDALNLAEVVVDGGKVGVPRRGQAPVASEASQPAADGAPAPINVNTADQAALETIPGIGPVKAGAIIEHRTRAGPFPSVDALIEVTGIGPATLESMRPHVTV
jgi:competence protein ComEA